MYCSACGSRLATGASHCHNCGAFIVGERPDAAGQRSGSSRSPIAAIAVGLGALALVAAGGVFALSGLLGDGDSSAIVGNPRTESPAPSPTPQNSGPTLTGLQTISPTVSSTTAPVTPTPSPTPDCRSFAPGCEARVINVAPENLFLRRDPGINATVLERMSQGSIVCIRGSQTVQDNTTWWPIKANFPQGAMEGWAAQYNPAPPSTQFLEPTGATCQV